MRLASGERQVRLRFILDVALATAGLSAFAIGSLIHTAHVYAAIYLVIVGAYTCALDFSARRTPLLALCIGDVICLAASTTGTITTALAVVATISVVLIGRRISYLPLGDLVTLSLALAATLTGFAYGIAIASGIALTILLTARGRRAAYPLAGTIATNLAIVTAVPALLTPRF